MNPLISHSQTIYTKLDDLTAKHSFLKNSELKAMTFSHIQDKKWWLLNAALTCKDFLDIALDALWEELDSFMPLLRLLRALQFENDKYVCANVHAFIIYNLILSLGPHWGYFSGQSGIDCDITLKKSRFSTTSVPLPLITRFILRLIFELLNFSHLLSFRLFVTSTIL